MRVKPNLNAVRKTQFVVSIEEEEFTTWASDEHAAMSNAAFRYAEEHDEGVALVMWKMKNDELYCEVNEV